MIYSPPVFNQDLKPLISINITKETHNNDSTPKPYIIKEGDTLTSISEAQGTTVERLWAANTQLTNPDVLAVADPLKIPLNTDVLTERPLPAMISNAAPTLIQSAPGRIDSVGSSVSSGAYGVGWCTSYAAARHPVPGNLGNASSWLYMAQADNLPTGFTPAVGAIAVARSYSHVAIVEKVEGDRVFVSEQNYEGYGIVSSRWTTASEWQGYIY